MSQNLETFLKPGSVAIVGASADTKSISGRPLRLLKEMAYSGHVYPVNPKYPELLGYPCYAGLRSLPEVPDTVIIAVNSKVAISVLRECVDLGVKNAIIFSSGFAEAGNHELQAQLDEIVALGRTRICGPNCQGMVNLFDGFPASFSAALDVPDLLPGPAAFLSQSGALGFSTFNMAQEKGIGMGYVVTTGNQCDIEVTELADKILDDDRVRVVICYLEGIRDVSRLSRAAKKAREVGKPLCVLKVGRSQAGQKAAQSHTAALAGSAEVFDAFARQEGIVLLNDIDEVHSAAAVFGTGKRPLGNRVGILTSSGGAGILMADRLEELGMTVPELPEHAQEIIRKCIPAFGASRNPVDLTAQVVNEAGGFRTCLDAVLACDCVDSVVVTMTMIVGQSALQVAHDIVDAARKTTKPIVVCWTIGPLTLPVTLDLARDGIPLFRSPAACARSLAMLVNYAQASRHFAPQESGDVDTAAREEVQRLLRQQPTGKALTENASKQVLRAYGLPVTREGIAGTAQEAAALAADIGFPVAIKVSSPDILHKTEAGAVKLGVTSTDETIAAFDEIMANSRRHAPNARIEGVLVQEMMSGGVEVIAGVKRDPQYGPVVMFGLGGIFVEVLKDVSFRIAPFGHAEALRMIKETKAFAVLAGARGRPRADIDALADLLVGLSRFAHESRDLVDELDLNPCFVFPEGKGVRIIDALLVPTRR